MLQLGKAEGRISPGGTPALSDFASSTSRIFANSFRFFVEVQGMQLTPRQRPMGEAWKLLAGALALGLALGFAGPFGSYPAFPTAVRYAFWLGLTVAGVMAAIAADLILAQTSLRAGPVRTATVALVSAIPMTFVVAWTMSFLQPGRFFSPSQLIALYGAVAAVQMLISFVTLKLPRWASHATPPDPIADLISGNLPEAAAAFPPALLAKLPPSLGSQIIALETEDHYLRVHAAGGSALILMRMGDAVTMIDPRLGAQVHRRWWVADAAVADLRTEDRRLCICLVNGSLVPVGRTFSPAARSRFGRPR